ncbi:MAG: hypothetical protein ACTSXN_05000 [Promethearchaeota archaeon]
MIAEEFWVVNWKGKPLYRFSPEEKMKLDLFTDFFQTIQSFARSIIEDDQDHINTITLGKYNYNFHNNSIYQLYFILKCSTKSKRKAIKALLSTFENLFIENYRAELTKPEIDPLKFEKFQNKIEKYFDQDILDKMTKRTKSNAN